jgi:general secretion pathway protein G
VTGISIEDLRLPVAVALGGIAAVAYLISFLRRRRSEFAWTDGMILVVIMAIVSAAAIPALSAFGGFAKPAALQESLRIVRTQIEMYKVEHGGQPPLLFKGALPQMTHATNVEGVPGPAGSRYPFGPYLPGGIPANPFTGSYEVNPTEVFPPTAATGRGGWLYHQQTGRITADLDGYLME